MASRVAPPSANLPAKLPSVPANQTLYITNLPSAKIQKEDLRTALYMLFSTYGPVLDVVALKTQKMRGQAHIVYRDVQTATQAMRSLNGFEFLGRELKITYAKSKSNIISKLDGSFKTISAAAAVEVTDLQQSIFNTPAPGTSTTGTGAAATSTSAEPSKPGAAAAADHAMTDATEGRGTKRSRDEKEEEEEEESDSDVAMEEDSDDE